MKMCKHYRSAGVDSIGTVYIDRRQGEMTQLLFSSSLLSAVLTTGEVWEFLSFTERHPSIIYNILLFGLTSALGQVGG